MFVCVFPFCSSSSISSYILCLIFVFIFVLVFSSPLFPSFFIAVVVGTEYILHSTTTSPAAASQSFPPNWDRPHDCRSSTFRCVGAIVCKKCKERWYLNTISLPICRIWLRDSCNSEYYCGIQPKTGASRPFICSNIGHNLDTDDERIDQ